MAEKPSGAGVLSGFNFQNRRPPFWWARSHDALHRSRPSQSGRRSATRTPTMLSVRALCALDLICVRREPLSLSTRPTVMRAAMVAARTSGSQEPVHPGEDVSCGIA